MKKLSVINLLLLLLVLAWSGPSKAQVRQFAIGGGANEVAMEVKNLPDGSGTIIAGYRYDPLLPGATDITNAQMILLKVNPAGTAILWQQEFGMAGSNNLIQNMIITNDGNIVVVGTMGRTNTYLDNHAAILKFRSTDGSLMWQSSFSAGTVGGELFFAVTELGASKGHALVAVGAYDQRPVIADALISVFSAGGTLLYSERYNNSFNTSESFNGICTSDDGNDVFIVGSFRSINYGDARVHRYTPLVTPGSGAWVWHRYFDFVMPGLSVDANGNVIPGSQILNNNTFSEVYQRGSKLLIMGGSNQNFILTGGTGEAIVRMNALDGSGIELKQLQNSNRTYCGPTKFFPLTDNSLVNIQTPFNSWFDPIIWLTGVATNSVITEVTSYTTNTASVPVQLTTDAGGIHALYDLDVAMGTGNMYFAGSTNDPNGAGNNDIYFVDALTTVADSGCWEPDTVGMLNVVPTTTEPTMTLLPVAYNPVLVSPVPTNYVISSLCERQGDPHFECDSSTFDETLTDLTFAASLTDSGCSFVVTATGITLPGWSVIGYLWNYGGSSIWDATTSSTDVKTVTVGYSGSEVVTVTYYAVNANGDTCYTNRTVTLKCKRPPCYFEECSKLTVTQTSSGDSCTFTACVNICTANRILGYSWTLSTGGSVTHHTSATSDCWTFTIPSGVTATVQVVAHIIDSNFADGSDPCCRAVFSEEVRCGKNPPNGCDCFDEASTTINYASMVGTLRNCRYMVTATAGMLNPQCVIVGYEWNVGGTTTFVSSSALFDNMIVSVPTGTVVHVQVKIIAVSPSGDTCTITRSLDLNCDTNPGEGCNCFDQQGTTINSALASTVDGCEFTVSALAALVGNCQIVAHQWTINGIASPMVSSGSNFEMQVVTMLGGTTTTVSITFYAIAPNGDTCTITRTIILDCPAIWSSPKPGSAPADKQQKIMIYPNPTNEEVTVTSSAEDIRTIDVYDVNGRKVAEYKFANVKSANIPMQKLVPAAYMLKINASISRVVVKGGK